MICGRGKQGGINFKCKSKNVNLNKKGARGKRGQSVITRDTAGRAPKISQNNRGYAPLAKERKG